MIQSVYFLFDIRGPARAQNVEKEIFGWRDVLYQVSQSLKFKLNWFSMMKLSLLTLQFSATSSRKPNGLSFPSSNLLYFCSRLFSLES